MISSDAQIENVVAMHGDPLGDPAVNSMRRYLLDADLVGGYLPQIVFPEPASRLWTAFWFAVRRIDDLTDHHGFEILERIEAAEELDALIALRAFVAAAPPAIEPLRRVVELSHTPAAEAKLLASDTPAPARRLFDLWFYKAYVPTYVGLRMLLVDTDDPTVCRLSMLAGAAMQWLDDLFDLYDDLRLGRLWLSREELELLGLIPWPGLSRLTSATVSRITGLREAISLAYFLAAHHIAARLPSPFDRRRATAFVEEFLCFYALGQFRVYPPGQPRPWTAAQISLRLLPGSENLKYRVLHTLNALFLALPLRRVNLRSMHRHLDRLGGCPSEVAPAVCLKIMEGLEEELGRRWRQGVIAPEKSPLGRFRF